MRECKGRRHTEGDTEGQEEKSRDTEEVSMTYAMYETMKWDTENSKVNHVNEEMGGTGRDREPGRFGEGREYTHCGIPGLR